MKHGNKFWIGTLVTVVLAGALLITSGQGEMAVISACDPCTEGVPVVPLETYPRASGKPITSYRQFTLEEDSDVCLLLENNGCGGAEVKIDGFQLISPGQLNPGVFNLVATTSLSAGNHALSVKVVSAEGCSVDVELRACVPEPPLCSEVAADWCEAKGFEVDLYTDGAVVCTAVGHDVMENCADCTLWNLVVYEDGAGDPLCPGDYSTRAGHVYGGHIPCICSDNLYLCQTWDMQDCQPD